MKKLYLLALLIVFNRFSAQAQSINFSSEYDKITWPTALGVGGGITGDDNNYKRLALFHGNSISLQTGSNLPGIINSRLYIDALGKIGIGTTSPLTKLQVTGGGLTLGANVFAAIPDGHLSLGNIYANSTPTSWTNVVDQTTLILNAQDYSTIGFNDSENRMDFIRVGNGTIDLGYDGGWGRANIGFTNGIWKVDGRVGIGTTNPVSKLQITGGGLTLGSNIVAAETDGHLSLGDINTDSNPTGQNWVNQSSLLLNAANYTTIGFHDSNLRVDFIRSGGGTIDLGYDGGFGRANIGFANGVWRSDGNVGIGTANPGSYKLAVEGKIGAREVEVKTGSWADFVFEPDYYLRPLSEVANYVQAYHHLPDIPSEAEVKEKGINLGDINTKLLQKIEELTLYSIQLEKQNQQLKGQQEQDKVMLQKELSQLKELVSQLVNKR